MWQSSYFLRNNREKTKTDVFLFSPNDFHISTADISQGQMAGIFELPANDPRWARLTRLMAETVFLKYYENESLDREKAFELALQELNRRLPDLFLNFGRSWLTDIIASFVLLTDDSCFFFHLGAPVNALWITEHRAVNIMNKLDKEQPKRPHPLKIFSQYHRAPIDALKAFCLAGPMLTDVISLERLGDVFRTYGSAQAVQQLQKYFNEIPNNIPLYGFVISLDKIGTSIPLTLNQREFNTPNRVPATPVTTKINWHRQYRWFVLKLQRFSLKQKGLLLASGLTLLIFCSTVGVFIIKQWYAARQNIAVSQKQSLQTELSAASAAGQTNNQGLAYQHLQEAKKIWEALPKAAQTDALYQNLIATEAQIFHGTTVNPESIGQTDPPPLLFEVAGALTWDNFKTKNKIKWSLPKLIQPLEKPSIAASLATANYVTILDSPTKRILTINKKTGETTHLFTWTKPRSAQNAFFDEARQVISLLSGTNVYEFKVK